MDMEIYALKKQFKERDTFWDSLKFVLIFLVVYGHMLMPEYQSGNHINTALFNLIYFFHMPLFVFISGRFSQIKDNKKYGRSILRILETFIVLQILYSVLFYFQNDVLPLDIIWKPQLHLWYLLALVWWRLILKNTPPSG